MTIVGAEVLEFHRALDGASWNPSFRWRERRAALLLIGTDTGTIGVGEAWAVPSSIESVLGPLATAIAPRLIGRTLSEREALVAEVAALPAPDVAPWATAAAASALDIALWDATARTRGEPLWRTLGGTNGRVRVYASGGLYRDGASPEDLAQEMRAEIDAGFRAVKMKIGALPLADDLARVRAVRNAIGADATLWVDAVNQLGAADAAVWCAALREVGVAAIQAPLPFDDVAGMARLNRALPVIAGEVEHRAERFAALLDAGAVAYLQFCLGLCGGFGGAARLDRAAIARGVATTPQCFSTAILQAASLHFGAACGNVAIVEYHRFHDHLAGLMPTAMRRVRDGFIELDATPGLGLALPRPGPQPCGGVLALRGAVGAPLPANPS